ncbi:MAG TPA: TlpA family protein disulfide reductase [Candidatus Acetothermia bacterium]|mgnify:CR=1 FL=1|nr:TlpA family protein disulfide reductase [Candidatus Acetothermia bacterium]
MRTFGVWLTVGLAGLLLWSVIAPEEVVQPTPAMEFALENLDGDIVRLSDFQGEVVVIDFWATWCAPCLTSFPSLHALLEPYFGEGVRLLLICLDRSADPAREYLADQGFPTQDALWGSLHEARAVQELYSVVGIPWTIVIDRDGLIRYSGHPLHLSEDDLLPWLE